MTFVFFAALKYDSVIGGRTRQLASVLAAEGHEVVFVEMPSLRSGLRFLRGKRREGNITIITLPPLPGGWRLQGTPPGELYCRVCARLLRTTAAGKEGAGITRVVSTPWWLPLLRRLPARGIIYDCLDHISVMVPAHSRAKGERWERELAGRAAGVAVVKERLTRELATATSGKPVRVIPNGVHTAWMTGSFSPMELPGRKGVPKIGFIGALYEWVDQGLIAQAARALPEYDFIIAGPTRRGIAMEELENAPNIRLMDAIPFEMVPCFITALDVALIPFHRDIISDCADPLKLYEYAALGVPVVSTADFNPEIPCSTGKTPEEFITHIRRLAEMPREERALPRNTVAAYTWQALGRRLAGFAEELI